MSEARRALEHACQRGGVPAEEREREVMDYVCQHGFGTFHSIDEVTDAIFERVSQDALALSQCVGEILQSTFGVQDAEHIMRGIGYDLIRRHFPTFADYFDTI